MIRYRQVYILCLLLLSFLFSGQCVWAQKKDKQARKEERAKKKQKKLEEGRLLVTPLAGPAYTPELELLIAASVMTSFKTKLNDPTIQRSTFPVSFGVSTTGAIVFSGILTSFWAEDKIRINGDFWFKDMPDHYWGVGYEQARNTEKGDSTTLYQRLWWQFNPMVLYQFEKHHFVGLNIDYNYTKATDPAPQVREDPFYQQFGEENFNGGLGLVYQFDNRDIPVNAWRGMFLFGSYTFYAKGLGSDNEYQVLDLDFRKYINLFQRVGSTLAIQVRNRIGMGDVPYGEMSQLGTPFDLRGYTWGRYRHQDMLFGIAEYRHQFDKSDGSLSKHGAVVWTGLGAIGMDMSEYTNWLPNLGLGYRLEVQPRMNLRVDFGFGRDSFGFYFNFTEAF